MKSENNSFKRVGSADRDSAIDSSSLDNELSSLTSPQQAILNQCVHSMNILSPNLYDDFPDQLSRAFDQLRSDGLLVETDDSVYSCPDEVLVHSDGPGLRWDHPLGVWHRITEASRTNWLETHDLADTLSGRVKLLNRWLTYELNDDESEFIRDGFDNNSIISANEYGRLPSQVNDIWSEITDESTFESLLINGQLLPVWNQSDQITGYIPALFLPVPDGSDGTNARKNITHDRDDIWDQFPFTPAEQIKITLILTDALPVRTTKGGGANVFDLKETSDISGWELNHVYFLFLRARELGLVCEESERYYLTERCKKWRESLDAYPVRYSRVPLLSFMDDDPDHENSSVDFSGGRLIEELNRWITRNAEKGVHVDELLDWIRNNSVFQRNFFTHVETIDSLESRYKASARSLLRLLYWLGLIDVFRNDDDEIIGVRANERNLNVSAESNTTQSDYPIILQPDGQVLVSLESPLKRFRHINPFALLIKVDRMMSYKIDKKSLVQALNKGWDAAGFAEFLENNTGELPGPVRDLFDDVLGDVQSIDIKRVHHLLEFEDGSITTRALSILSNYDPMRVDENRILLESKTSAETIRRNLSRGGIRLRNTTSKGNCSPYADS